MHFIQRSPIKATKLYKFFLPPLFLLSLEGCIAQYESRGHLADHEEIEKIVPHQDQIHDVIKKLGSPSTTDPFNKRKWYYIGTKTKNVAFLDPKVEDHNVYAIHFDEHWVVERVETVDGSKAVELQVVKRVTPTAGHETTAIQQILGNFGRFSTNKKKD